jgi:hypothetical protein
MTIKVTYYDDTYNTFESFQDINDYQNSKIIYCDNNQLTSLPQLPLKLQVLDCGYNQLTQLPKLPDTLLSLYCGNNLLTSLPTLPNKLLILCCKYNQLTTLPTLPNSLLHLYCYDNLLTQLPVSLLFCRNLTYIAFSGNPFELTEQQLNFIISIQERNTQRNHKGYHQDTQNVHNSALQKSLIVSIHNLLTN